MLLPVDLPTEIIEQMNSCTNKPTSILCRDTLRMVIELKIWNSVGGEEFHDKLDYIMK
jgi:hypothetical protein